MTLLALRNSIAILMASLGVAILGLVALGRLPVDLFPNINLPIINVGTIYTGAGVLDERQLYDLASNAIEPQLERLGGVASASIDGGKVRQITVNLNRDQLYAKGVSIVDVVSAVNSANFLLPAGDMKAGRLDYNLYTNNQFAIVPPMENIVVRTVGPNGVPIHVKDLGYVADSHETQTSIVRIDDERGVFLSVNKQPGANTIAVVDQVKRSEEHTSELQSRLHLVCRLLLEKKKQTHSPH